MTEEQLKVQEKLDNDVYSSTRALFETLLAQTLAAAVAGEDYSAKHTALLEAYNGVSQSCQRMVGRCRRLEKAAVCAADALTPPNGLEEKRALAALQQVLKPSS